MGNEFIYIAFLLFFLLIIYWIGGIDSMYKYLLLIFIGVLIVNTSKIKELVSNE